MDTFNDVDFAMLNLPTVRRTPEEEAAKRDLAERREAAASEAYFRAHTCAGESKDSAKRAAAAAAGGIRE